MGLLGPTIDSKVNECMNRGMTRSVKLVARRQAPHMGRVWPLQPPREQGNALNGQSTAMKVKRRWQGKMRGPGRPESQA